ncbi:MAG: hypothetical protein LBP64_09510, partial [Tannerella sp.]|nr:hypothetical protein [Tannerella sp.]
MNKKILTLIASVLVLLGTVFSANAQDIWDLGIGKNKDVDLKSSKYYHLKIDSIIVEGNNNKGVDAIGPNRLDSTLVLFMKDTLLDNQNRAFLFVDSINTTYRGESLNTVRSASSLWCVSVEIDQQGKNKTFDFVNKHSSNLLELDVAYPEHAYGDTAFIPGAVMGWHFSETDGLSGSKVRPK